MNTMTYKGYAARIEYDTDDRIFVGHVAGIRDIIGFHGTSVDELENAFHESLDHYLAVCDERGDEPQKPYSGNLMLRINPDIHAAVATAVQLHGKSINQWVAQVLDQAANSSR